MTRPELLLDPGFGSAAVELRGEAGAMDGIGNFLSPTGRINVAAHMQPRFFEISALPAAIAQGMMPGADPPDQQAATGGCPTTHPYRGCTMYRTTSYALSHCDGWSVFAGGIGIGRGVLSVDVAADRGLWRRRRHYAR